MDKKIEKYISKLVKSGSAEPDSILFGMIDDRIEWNRTSPDISLLDETALSLNISFMLYARPPEPIFSIMNILAEEASGGTIKPQDTETRTFLHEIPVISALTASSAAGALMKRKALIVIDRGIITHGIVSAEQAYVTYCSVLFSLWVKFFADTISVHSPARSELARRALGGYISVLKNYTPGFIHTGILDNSGKISAAMCEAGRATVDSGLVDSFFGNISFRSSGAIYISRTGSSLDELEGEIEVCPLDRSSTASITASSEYSAHRAVYEQHRCSSILHGHPKSAVVMSMLCSEENCPTRGRCHTSCTRERFIGGIPIIPGEVGTGKFGLNRTLPGSLKGMGSIVWGHGLFTTGKIDFTDAFNSMIEIEVMCADAYLDRLQ